MPFVCDLESFQLQNSGMIKIWVILTFRERGLREWMRKSHPAASEEGYHSTLPVMV